MARSYSAERRRTELIITAVRSMASGSGGASTIRRSQVGTRVARKSSGRIDVPQKRLIRSTSTGHHV